MASLGFDNQQQYIGKSKIWISGQVARAAFVSRLTMRNQIIFNQKPAVNWEDLDDLFQQSRMAGAIPAGNQYKGGCSGDNSNTPRTHSLPRCL
ncbi:MAG TPA: hypothetical protein VI451_17210 [Anaerolineales bacterium]|nr:hypothetical protein [Anaerolineales bacterium]